MKSNGDTKYLSVDNSPGENNNNNSHMNLLLYLEYLSNQNTNNANNSPYENGGIKNKIHIEQLLEEIGPFLLTVDIDLLNIHFIDYNLDINRFSELLIFIINNSVINYNNNDAIKQLNKFFLESIKQGSVYIEQIENIQHEITWDLNAIYNLFKNQIESFDKNKLLICFDNPKLNINDKKKFDLFCDILIKFNLFGKNEENIQSFYDEFLFIKWKNIKNQIELLNLMITNKEISENSKFCLNNYQGQKISKDIDTELRAFTSTKNRYLKDNWRIVKIVEILIIISKEFDNYNQIKIIFDWAIRNIPEIILMSLLTIKIDFTQNPLMTDLIIETATPILFDKNPRIKLINEIWQLNKDIVIYVLNNSWKNYPDLMNLSSILDLANNIIKDSLLVLVHSKYHNFSIHLGLLASKRDYLFIEKWLKKNVDEYKDDFVLCLINYLNINIVQPCKINKDSGIELNETNKGNILEKAQLSQESLSIILNILNTYINNDNNIGNKLSLNTKNQIAKISKILFDLYDEIKERHSPTEFDSKEQKIKSKEIEEEVSKLLRPMFEGKISPDNVVNLLIMYKKSNDKRKVELFSCLIHQLIYEYNYLSNYPKNKLKIFAELFGKIINNKLFDGVLETLALKYILDSIKNDSDNLNYFGITSLKEIINNISSWPKFVIKLLNIDKFKQQNNNLYMLILSENEKIQKRFIFEKSKNNEKQNGFVPSTKSEHKSSDIDLERKTLNTNTNSYTMNALSDIKEKEVENNIQENVDNLKYKLSGSPKSFISNENQNMINNNIIINNSIENIALIEKITFNSKNILENNNQTNIIETASEINKLITNDELSIKIFGYIILTTQIIQTKNLTYFNELFNIINNQLLNKYIYKYTIKYIQILLKIKSLYIEEKPFNFLKNLGTWLGYITIHKNKPVLVKDIDFRELITNSFKNGQLITTIPFICKVFAFVAKSKIFNANNPWINSILCLLKEIYFMQALNQLIKKEIQNLFEFIKVDINALKINITYLNKINLADKEERKLDFPSHHELYINIDKNKLEKKVEKLNNFITNLLSILNNEKNSFSNYFLIQNLEIFDTYTTNKINEIIYSNLDAEKKNSETRKDIVIFLSNLLYQSILDTLPKMSELYLNKPITSSISIVSQDLYYDLNINKYKTAVNNVLIGLLSSFSLISFHYMLKSNLVINLELCVKSHNVSREKIAYIKELPNSEYINIGSDEILKYITNEAQRKLYLNPQFLTEIEKRNKFNSLKQKTPNGNGIIYLNKNNDDYFMAKIWNKLPEKIRPNKDGITPAQFKIYESFQTNQKVVNMYNEEGKICNFLNVVFRILKEALSKNLEGNNSIKESRIKNYESCMKEIMNKFNLYKFDLRFNSSDEDLQNYLNFLKLLINDNKTDKIDIINKMAMKTLDFVIISTKMNNLLLLNIYIFILRGWTKLNDDLKNQITKKIFEYDFNIDIFTLFKFELHLYLFKQKLINVDLYENYLINLLKRSSVINYTIHYLLNNLLSSNYINVLYNKNSFKKIDKFLHRNKINENYYLLFNNKTSILMSMALNYNSLYKTEFDSSDKSLTENNNSLDITDKKDLYNLYLFDYINITKFLNDFIFNKEKKIFEENNIQNMLPEKEIYNCIKYIWKICMNNTSDSIFKKYSYLFYPEKLSIFIFYLIEYKNIPFIKVLDIIIQCFHNDYVQNNTNFNQKKYHKFFLNLIYLITNAQTYNNNAQENIINDLILISDTFKILSPKNYPGFALAWLDLISYYHFINYFLDTNLIKENSYKYEKYLSLLIELLNYLNQIKTQIIKHYNYKFILDQIYKFFFLLCQTYPYFISAYYYLLINCLSLSLNQEDEETNLFLQLKNIILSTSIDNKFFFKENYLTKQILKDNYITNKIIYLLTDSFDNEKQNKEDIQLKTLVDKYIEEGNDDNNILDDILELFDSIKNEKELNSVYNGLALYLFYYQKNNTQNKNKFTKKIFYNFYLFLLCNLNEIHKKHLIDSILNSLILPNLSIVDFSSLFQDLLLNIENEDIENQLIINLLERSLYKPIPSRIKNIIKSLLKNDKFKNMENNYLKSNAEIEYHLAKFRE